MKNIKRLGLTFIMLLTTSSFAFAQESEVVMTKEELTSFLEKIAENRRKQLRSEKTAKIQYIPRMKNVEERSYRSDESRLLHQLDRINDRIDNLFMLHAAGGTIRYRQDDLAILPESKKEEIVEALVTTEDDRILNAKTPEERRDALKDLLAKFKNFKKQVFFAHDSDKLSSEDMQYIKDVTDVLKKYPELSIVLEGWASPVGNANYNKQLSMRRSESVEKALLNRGITPNRIVSSFRGEDHSTSDAMARRVDMSVILK